MKNFELANHNFAYSNHLRNLLILHLIFIWFVIASVAMNYYIYLSWGDGLYLGGGLIFIGLLFFVFYYFREFIQNAVAYYNYPRLLKIIIIISCFSIIFYSLSVGFNRYQVIKKTNYIHHDIPASTYGAIKLLSRGDNPYAMNALVQNILYSHYLKKMFKHPQCLQGFDRRYLKYYNTHFQLQSNKFLEEKLVASLPKTEECLKISREPYWNYPLNYYYGPIMLATYFPAVSFFGKGGLVLCNMFMLLFLFSVVLFCFRTNNWKNPIGILLFTIFLCIPKRFNSEVMMQVAVDIVQTLFFLMALIVAARHKKSLWFPFFMALSVAAKISPGIILIPILFIRPKKEALFFVLLIFLFHLPFIIWEYQGLFSGLIYNILYKEAGDTGFLYHFHPAFRLIFKFCVVLSLLYCFIKLIIQNKSFSDICLFVFLSILGMLLVHKFIHANYIIWVQMIAAFCLFVWTNRIGFQEHQVIQYRWINNLVEKYVPRLSWHRLKEHFAK